MAKTNISKRRKESVTTTFVQHEVSSSRELADKKLVREVLIEALTSNDMDTFQDVLVGYIRTSSNLYDLIDLSKPFNPTLDNLGKIFKELAA